MPLKWLAWRRVAIILLAVFVLFKLLVYLVPLPEDMLFRPSATLVFDCNDKLLRAFTSKDDMWRIRTPLNRISPYVRKFQIAYEDRWFYWHSGINPVAVGRAFFQNRKAHRIVSGASTLTMQISRMMEPKQRTYFNKSLEILRAVQLEERFTKKKLLETYFNIAPYGGNIEGVAAASWLYFGKEPDQLSCGEAALLVALPNDPTHIRPDLYPDRAQKERDKVLQVVYKRGLVSKREYLEALKETVPGARMKLPFQAAHFCSQAFASFPGEARIYSTLNQRIQSLSEELLVQHVSELRDEGITNGAVIVLDNRTHRLLAVVGSADFFNEDSAGQVNGYLAPRSPGSALKPFVYALGFESGKLTPRHYLEDVPVDFRGGYSPENFDSKFSGMVSVEEALERSLNVPAVNALQMLGQDNGLYQLLRKVKFTTIAPQDKYGLSIVLGGCEVTLLELTSLYGALASSGVYQDPKLYKSQAAGNRVTLFSPGAAYLVTDILTRVRRPDLPACWEFTSLPKIAWKTGTSYGHRDAWSIGYNPHYTVGVWIGNFTGEGKPGLIGAEVAAPLLFNIFNCLNKGSGVWFKRPRTVKERKVCALSGQLPGGHCKNLVSELYLTDRSSEEKCKLHQSYWIDPQRGFRLPSHLNIQNRAVERTYINWPPRVAGWMEENGYPVEHLPGLSPDYQELLPGQAPVIRSPSENYQYQIREGVDREYQKICLEASAGNDVHKIYWFIDGKLVGTAAPGKKLFIWPEIGVHKVVCQDDQGRSSKMSLVVKN